jgi:hypothetical protein
MLFGISSALIYSNPQSAPAWLALSSVDVAISGHLGNDLRANNLGISAIYIGAEVTAYF